MDAIHAIDKFVAEATNYNLVMVDLPNKRRCVPQFIAEVKWNCNLEHMVDKWLNIAESHDDPSSYLVHFYCQLSNDNRERLLKWIIERGEHKFMFMS
jgi:hypothetical protein